MSEVENRKIEEENKKYTDISSLLKMAEEDPDGTLLATSILLEADPDLPKELALDLRLAAYSRKAINAIKSNNNNKINDGIIDLIEKALVEAKADDASEEKQNDYFGDERVNFFAKVLEEVKPGRVQELWGKTKLYYFGNRARMHEAIDLTEEEIWDFGKIFFTFPHIIKYATIMKPSNHEYITVFLSGKDDGKCKGWITIFRDGTVKIEASL